MRQKRPINKTMAGTQCKLLPLLSIAASNTAANRHLKKKTVHVMLGQKNQPQNWLCQKLLMINGIRARFFMTHAGTDQRGGGVSAVPGPPADRGPADREHPDRVHRMQILKYMSFVKQNLNFLLKTSLAITRAARKHWFYNVFA